MIAYTRLLKKGVHFILLGPVSGRQKVGTNAVSAEFLKCQLLKGKTKEMGLGEGL